MTPEFGAVFLWLIATILWWSGWKEEATESIPHWAVGVFLAVWPFALLTDVPIPSSQQINGAWLWTLLALITMAWRIHPIRRWMSISAGMLVASIYLLLSRLAYYPSGFSHYLAPTITAIVVGWLSALLLRNVPEQLLAITAALYISEGISALGLSSSDAFSVIKTSEWIEGWWIAVLFARFWSIFIKTFRLLTRKWALKLGWNKGRESS
jgi:hypothetical protein